MSALIKSQLGCIASCECCDGDYGHVNAAEEITNATRVRVRRLSLDVQSGLGFQSRSRTTTGPGSAGTLALS